MSNGIRPPMGNSLPLPLTPSPVGHPSMSLTFRATRAVPTSPADHLGMDGRSICFICTGATTSGARLCGHCEAVTKGGEL